MRFLRLFGLLVFVACLSMLLITFNLRWLINELSLYKWGFKKYEISQATGIPEEDLLRTAERLLDYFNFRSDSPQVLVLKQGKEMMLFNERELAHLQDVRDLIQHCYQALWASLAYVLAFLLAGFIWLGRAFLLRAMRGLFCGGLLTILLFTVVGVWAAVDFDSFFLAFHLASFRNELWLLDPAKDYLIAIFPEGFFFHAALFLAGAVIMEAVILASVSAIYLRRIKGRISSKPAGIATGS